jgi:hypothetical protein
VIAHPGAGASPGCHGCRWDLLDADMEAIDGVEAWNNAWPVDDDNERNLLIYDGWLGRGLRLGLAGGTDEHGDRPTFTPAAPTTQVYASELSRSAIVDGLRARHTVVTSGPELRVKARAGNASAIPGDTLPAGEAFNFAATVAGVDGAARLTITSSLGVLAETEIDGAGFCSYEAPRAEPGWYRAQLSTPDGSLMLALSSPIYVR